MRVRLIPLLIVLGLCWPLPAGAVQFGAGSGSSYPTTLDTINTRANKSGGACNSAIASNICAEFTNDLQGAIRAIQLELGTLPKGAFADVATRLNTGLQTPWTTNIVAAGYTLYGSASASGNLTLDSTSHSTKGAVILNSKIKITAGTPGTNYFLLSDSTGLATWFNLLGTTNTWTATQEVPTLLITKADVDYGPTLQLYNSSSTGGNHGLLFLAGTNGAGVTTWQNATVLEGQNAGGLALSGYGAGGLLLQTGGSRATRLSIDTSGNTTIAGTTAINGNTTITGTITTSGGATISGTVNAGGMYIVSLPIVSNPVVTYFDNSTGQVGRIASLRRMKEDIQSLNLGLSTVLQLHPVSFAWKSSHTRDLGFIAEEVQAVNPLLAEYDKDGVLTSVKYTQMTAVLAKAVQELDVRLIAIEAQTRRSTTKRHIIH